MFNDIFDSIYSICLTLFSITIAILLKFFINKRKVKTFKLSIVNHEFDIFPSIIFGFGITLCFMEILKYIIFGCVYKEPHLYLYTPVFISSYFIVFFLGYSLTKKDSKFNHMWAAAIYVISSLLMIIILIIPNLTFDGMFKRINEKTPIEHYTVYTTMYHSITDMGGIIFLIFCPYRIRKIKNLGMALVPILPWTIIGFAVSTGLYPTGLDYNVDLFNQINLPIVSKWYENFGGNDNPNAIVKFNLIMLSFEIFVFIVSYYFYYISSVLIPNLFFKLKTKFGQRNSIS